MSKSSRGWVVFVTLLLMVFVAMMVAMFGRSCSLGQGEAGTNLVYYECGGKLGH